MLLVQWVYRGGGCGDDGADAVLIDVDSGSGVQEIC